MLKKLLRVLSSLVFCFFTSSCFAQHAAQQVTFAFYKAYANKASSGLLSAEEIQTYTPFLSKKLRSLIESARLRQAEFIKHNPQEKPPFVEGDMFSSLFEGPTSFGVGKYYCNKKSCKVQINFVYEEADSEAFNWRDTAVLIKEQGEHRIDNVLYSGNWDFKTGNNLKQNLLQNK